MVGVLAGVNVDDGVGVLLEVEVGVGVLVGLGVGDKVGVRVGTTVGAAPRTMKRPITFQSSPTNIRTSYSPGNQSEGGGFQSVYP